MTEKATLLSYLEKHLWNFLPHPRPTIWPSAEVKSLLWIHKRENLNPLFFFSNYFTLAAAVKNEDDKAVIINFSVDTDWVADLNADYLLFPKSATRSFVRMDMLFSEVGLTRHQFCFLLSVTGSDNTPTCGLVKKKEGKMIHISYFFFLKKKKGYDQGKSKLLDLELDQTQDFDAFFNAYSSAATTTVKSNLNRQTLIFPFIP